MEKRRGPSISVKMIFATTTIVVLIVAFFGVANVYTLNNVFANAAQALEDSTIKGLESKGNSLAGALAGTTKTALRDNDFSNLQASIPEVWRKDPELKEGFLYVTDDKGSVMASNDPTQSGKLASDPSWAA